jgi:hypothetical protein
MKIKTTTASRSSHLLLAVSYARGSVSIIQAIYWVIGSSFTRTQVPVKKILLEWMTVSTVVMKAIMLQMGS